MSAVLSPGGEPRSLVTYLSRSRSALISPIETPSIGCSEATTGDSLLRMNWFIP